MSGTDHHHDHDAHAEIGSGARPGYYDMMETAIRELLVENRLVAGQRSGYPKFISPQLKGFVLASYPQAYPRRGIAQVVHAEERPSCHSAETHRTGASNRGHPSHATASSFCAIAPQLRPLDVAPGARFAASHLDGQHDHRPSRNVSGSAERDRCPPIGEFFPKTESDGGVASGSEKRRP